MKRIVSVAITTYEHEPFIAQAIDSVLAQEGDFELDVVIGEDRSQDRTREIVAAYQARHPETIRAVLPETNLGAGGKRLFAAVLDACRGTYIAAMDGDDYWTSPRKLQIQIDFLDRHPGCAMCFHDVERIREGAGPPPRPTRNQGSVFTAEDVLFQRVFIAACSPMFRAEALRPLPAWYLDVPFGDWPLYIQAAQHGDLCYLDQTLGVYRVHAGGMWSRLSPVDRVEQRLECYRVLDRELGHCYGPALRQAMAGARRELRRLRPGPLPRLLRAFRGDRA
jgi:glycosyltransferase involved in cell wall biosynthesis